MRLTLISYGVLFGLLTVLQLTEEKLLKIREENEEEAEIHSVSKREASDTLLFPGDNIACNKQTVRRDVVQQLNPSPCPDGASFCESADDYPKDRVQALLKKQSKFILNQFYIEEDTKDVERFGDPEETSLCPSESKTIYPNKAQSREGVLEFIVNEENYKQGIKVEACVKDGNSCNLPGSLSLGYSSHCRQKYILRTLVVVNKNVSDVEGFITKPFEFPSCCACKIVMKDDRFGGGSEHQLPITPATKTTQSSVAKG